MNARDLIVAVAALTACLAAFGAAAQDAEREEVDSAGAYIGVSGAMTLPQGGSDRMRRLGGAAVRAGWYLGEFWSVEGEAAWLENSAGFAAQGLWHWQSADVYGRMFGYSQFDPFFTFGARGALNATFAHLLIWLLPSLIIGTAVGVHWGSRVDEKKFRAVVITLIFVSGLSLLF